MSLQDDVAAEKRRLDEQSAGILSRRETGEKLIRDTLSELVQTPQLRRLPKIPVYRVVPGPALDRFHKPNGFTAWYVQDEIIDWVWHVSGVSPHPEMMDLDCYISSERLELVSVDESSLAAREDKKAFLGWKTGFWPNRRFVVAEGVRPVNMWQDADWFRACIVRWLADER